MRGVIEWSERRSGMVYSGVVTHCYRNADCIRVIHTCEDYGVGELAIALKSGLQDVTCNYLSDYDDGPSEPLVRGTLSWQPHGAVFTGTWFDANVEVEASDVVVTIEECDLTVSVPAPLPPVRLIGEQVGEVDVIIKQLGGRLCTSWKTCAEPPQLPGVYELRWLAEEARTARVFYTLWDGALWYGPTETIADLRQVHLAWKLIDDDVSRQWRGLTKKASRTVASHLERLQRIHCEREIPGLITGAEQARSTLALCWRDAQAIYLCLREAASVAHQFDASSRRILHGLDFSTLEKDFAHDPSLAFPIAPSEPSEELHRYLMRVQVVCNEQIGLWRDYWKEHLKLLDDAGDSGSSVVDWGAWLKPFHRGTWRRLPGSYGTGKA
ncbi:hypothetical protein MRBLMS1_000384 [Massilia sp. LMS1-1-1.1]